MLNPRLGSWRQIEAFSAVARLGSVSLAADELHLSQSAVSIQIGSLETSVGAPLVVRTGRGVRLTEVGEVLRGHTERLLAMWAEASDEIATFLGEFSGTLKVGAVTTAEYLVPHLLVAFVDLHPRVKIKLQVANRDEIVRLLASHEIDIAVMGQPPSDIKVDAAPFATNPCAFVASPRHPLMHQGRLSMATLADSRLLVRERGSGSRTTAERLFKEARLRLRPGSELSSNEAIKQLCVAGFGPAYLSMHACVLELKAGLLAVLPMANNPVQRQWCVVRSAARAAPHVAMAFEEFLIARGQAEIHKRLPARWLLGVSPRKAAG